MKNQKYSKEFEEWFDRANSDIYIYNEFSRELVYDIKRIAWKAWNAGRDRLKKENQINEE